MLHRRLSIGRILTTDEIMAGASVLNAFNKLPVDVNSAVILIIGAPGVGKNQLAKELLTVQSSIALEVRTATSLPLPEENSIDRPRIDFVVVMVDLTNRESYTTVKKSLQLLDVSFFVGRLCFIMTRVDNAIERCVTINSVVDLADSYASDTLTCNLQNVDERCWMALQLVNKLRQFIGVANCDSLLIDATSQLHRVTQDEQNLTNISHRED